MTESEKQAALEAFAREHIIHMDYVETMYANIHDKNWDKDSQRLADWLSAWQVALDSKQGSPELVRLRRIAALLHKYAWLLSDGDNLTGDESAALHELKALLSAQPNTEETT